MTDSMLDKVRKLLAKAEDPGCTPAEAAALNDKAAEIIAKYGVDRALLAAAAPEIGPGGEKKHLDLSAIRPGQGKPARRGRLRPALPLCPDQAADNHRPRLWH